MPGTMPTMRSKTNWELQINCKYNIQLFPVQQCSNSKTQESLVQTTELCSVRLVKGNEFQHEFNSKHISSIKAKSSDVDDSTKSLKKKQEKCNIFMRIKGKFVSEKRKKKESPNNNKSMGRKQ